MDTARKLLGLWQPDQSCYGGLIQIKIDQNQLIGIEWRAIRDADVQDPLRRLDMFSFQLPQDWEKEVVGLCLGGYSGPHMCQILLKDETNFYFKCCQPENHRHPQGDKKEMLEWVHEIQVVHGEDTDNSDDLWNICRQQLLTEMLSTIQKYENSYKCNRINVPGPLPDVLVQPGLFKGTYGPHGMEIIMLNYEDNGTIIKATKITGDPNVPAGQMTFQVDTRYRMALDEAQQATIKDLEALEKEETEEELLEPSIQPFVIPEDCEFGIRNTQLPSECVARFHGEGQVAADGFIDPSECPGHFIVFSNDFFGFLWLDLSSLSLYHRINDF